MSRIQKSHAQKRPQSNPGDQAAPRKGPGGTPAVKPNANRRAGKLEGSFAAQQRRINEGVKGGTLTQAEAQQLQTKLDALHGRFVADAFESPRSKAKVPGYRDQLGALQKETKTALENDDVDTTKLSSSVDERIADGLADGTLTQAEATVLKTRADAIKLEQTLALTPDAQKAIATKFRALSKDVGTERKDAEFDATLRKSSFETRIAAGVTDGSLTAREAAQLRKSSTKLGTEGSAYERLNQAIYQARHDNQVSAPKMGTSLKDRVATLERSGKLTAEQATAFRKSLDTALADGAKAAGARLNALRERLAAYA